MTSLSNICFSPIFYMNNPLMVHYFHVLYYLLLFTLFNTSNNTQIESSKVVKKNIYLFHTLISQYSINSILSVLFFFFYHNLSMVVTHRQNAMIQYNSHQTQNITIFLLNKTILLKRFLYLQTAQNLIMGSRSFSQTTSAYEKRLQ